MGIHYDYKSKRGERAMLKEAKRKARLAQRRAKRLMSSEESLDKEESKTHDIKKTITLEDLTNPNRNKMDATKFKKRIKTPKDRKSFKKKS